MDITLETYLIVCPLVFLAGLIDSIGGGGGLISLPAYLLAGIPAHYAIATNKLSSSCGTLITTLRFIKNKMIHAKLALPSIFAAILGSYLGAKISMLQSEKFMEYLLLLILPVVAVVVFHKKNFEVGEETELKITKKLYGIVMLSAFLIGMYDGFYCPGTGTFLIIAFTLF
ncbi:MAG: sulfite exporter TauE/SafE family protein, partial [Clostridiales bacterium]|nr:sulfite exporter TauE/SafE family protein [Clostridiales bacterium]